MSEANLAHQSFSLINGINVSDSWSVKFCIGSKTKHVGIALISVVLKFMLSNFWGERDFYPSTDILLREIAVTKYFYFMKKDLTSTPKTLLLMLSNQLLSWEHLDSNSWNARKVSLSLSSSNVINAFWRKNIRLCYDHRTLIFACLFFLELVWNFHCRFPYTSMNVERRAQII